jgi:hypothetical protein
VVARAVALERPNRVVEGAAVELDSDPRPSPQAVHLEALLSNLEPNVRLRLRKTRCQQELEEPILELATRALERTRESSQNLAQCARTRPARIPLQEIDERW